ncbi:MAG: COX15/CtaA family protein [Nibricoccus sp.]
MVPASASNRTSSYKPGLAWFATLGSAWVFVLVTLGAFTTSIGAGMVFPDWPLSNGSLNPAGWLGNIAMFAEHSHRLSAGLMTMITIAIAVAVWRTEERRWLRRAATVAVILIFVQAFVGGLRVLLEKQHVEMIETSVGRLFAMAHACLAQIFVCTLVAIAAGCSRSWVEPAPADKKNFSPALRTLGIVCCALLLLQLAIAAVMRHSFAGLAIPSFPQSTPEGGWLPAEWNFRVGIHFAHRVTAVVLAVAIVWFSAALLRSAGLSRKMKNGAVLLIVLLVAQIALGAAVVLTGRQPHTTTAHVIVGASLLAATFLITWYLHRDAIEKQAFAIVAEKLSSSQIPANQHA